MAAMGRDLLIHLPVLTIVVLVQCVLLRRALRFARADEGGRLQQLAAHFITDVEQRAQRGQPPDWLRYDAEVERLFAARDERLRTIAAAALAVGLGSTILALIAEIVAVRLLAPDDLLEPSALIHGLGLALFGSLSGVLVHLMIVLRLLPKIEDRLDRAWRDLMERLAEVSERNPPLEVLTNALRGELASLRQSLNAEVSSAITSFPAVVSQLGERVSDLSEALGRQGETIGAVVRELDTYATRVAESGRDLAPVAAALAQSAPALLELPALLAATLAEERHRWITGLRDEQSRGLEAIADLQGKVEAASKRREEEMLAATRDLHAAVAEVRNALRQLPAQLATEVENSAGRLGSQFGREAHDHVGQLRAIFLEEHRKLLESIAGHEREWRNNVGDTVKKLLSEVSGDVREHLVGELKQVAGELRSVGELLPEAAGRLETAHGKWVEAQAAALARWDEVGTRTGRAADRLAEADGHLATVVRSLSASAEHLGRVARVSAEFEEAIRQMLREMAEQQLEAVQPVRRELLEVIRELHTTQERIDNGLALQVEFVNQFIEQLLSRRARSIHEVSA
jgi:ABC-type transporter Mla subunit MlaD